MHQETSTTAYLLDQCGRYPALRPEDLLKALHQSVFGCGHFVTDRAAGPAPDRRSSRWTDRSAGCIWGIWPV